MMIRIPGLSDSGIVTEKLTELSISSQPSLKLRDFHNFRCVPRIHRKLNSVGRDPALCHLFGIRIRLGRMPRSRNTHALFIEAADTPLVIL